MSRSSTAMVINLLTDVYADPAINHRRIGDSQDDLESLANSIEATGGILQRLVIYPTPQGAEHGMPYELGLGFRRRAALMLLAERSNDNSWVETVPVELRESEDTSQRRINQLAENLQRKNLSEMEIAIAFMEAVEDSEVGLTQSELARELGWPTSTVSNYISTAKNLEEQVQDLVLAGKFAWSSAKELASAVKKHDISPEHQVTLATAGCGMDHAKFLKYLKDFYTTDGELEDDTKPAEGESDEGESATEEKTVQHAHNTIRGTELEKKYIPKLVEIAKNATSEQEKREAEIRLDTIKFVLKMQGTQLGATLAPWEEELERQEEEKKQNAEAEKNKIKFVRQCVTAIKATLKEIPPTFLEDGVTPNPKREAPTLVEAKARVRATIEKSLADAKEAGKPENFMTQDFPVENIEDLMTDINNEYLRILEADKKRAEKNAEAKERKKQQKEQAGAEGESEAENAAESEEVAVA